jgi:hypothetical protein
MTQIPTKFLGNNQVTDLKERLRNNQPLRARNAADSGDVNIAKVDASNIVQLLSQTQIATSESSANDLARKTYVDTSLTGLTRYWNKEVLTLSSGDITNQYKDLGFLIESNSLRASVNGTPGYQSNDYTLSTVGGVTRITFAGDWATGGNTALIAGDKIHTQYMTTVPLYGTGSMQPQINVPWTGIWWINPADASHGELFMTYNATGDIGVEIRLTGSGGIFAAMQQNGSTYMTGSLGLGISASSWYMVALTYDGLASTTLVSHLFGAVNGNTLASFASTGNSGTVTDIVTGAGVPGLGYNQASDIGGLGVHFSGLMDEVQFYNRVLTQGEINAIYAQGPGGNSPGDVSLLSTYSALYAWYRFGDTALSPADSATAGGTIHDKGQGTHNGTKHGSTTTFSSSIPGSSTFSDRSLSFDGSTDYITITP